MAAGGARRALQLSSSSAKNFLTRSATRTTAKASPVASKSADKLNGLSLSSLPKLNFSRLPVELGGALSLMPLHSATASSLFTSLLSVHKNNWGCLSEGFATPL